MPTPVTVNVGSGQTYTTLSDWEANYPSKNLVSGDVLLTVNFLDNTEMADNTAFNSGWTTDATRYIILTATNRHTGQRNTGFALTSNASTILRPVTGVRIAVDGIRFEATANCAGGLISDVNGGTVALIDNCFIDGAGVQTNRMVPGSGSILAVRNSFATGCSDDALYAIPSITHTTVWNVTGSGRGLIGNTSGVITNCIVLGIGGDAIVANGSTVSYTIIDDTSATGTGVLQSRTATDNAAPGAGNWVVFTDITTAGAHNLTLQNVAENDAISAGVAGHATDFAGATRDNPPDVGADEFVVGGGGGVIPAASQSYRRRRN
jgi:hypothetical protein